MSSNEKWQSASRSGNGLNCVQVKFSDDSVCVRDSKNPDGPALKFTFSEWDAFIGGAKDGEFDRK